MANKITISTDSTSDLGAELYEKFDVKVVSLGVTLGSTLYRDGVDITPDDIYEAVEKKKIVPKTASGLESDYEEVFKEGTKNGGSVIHVSLSGKLSLSHDTAVKAAKNFKNVFVLDSKSLSTGTGLLVVKAWELANAGKSAEEIYKILTEMVPKVQCSFVLNELKYMHKGGRCSKFQLLGANLLSIHPMLYMEKDGRLVAGKKFKGKYSVVLKQYTDFILKSYPNADKDVVFITHTKCDPALEKQMEEDLKAAGFKTIYKTVAGSVITTHCGRETLGILFCEK